MKDKAYRFFQLIALAGALSSAHAQAPFIDKPYIKDEHAGFSYAIFNDEHSITVAVKVDDPAQALKLVRNGMDIWIDPKGKKTKKIGIHYPLGQTAENVQSSQGLRGQTAGNPQGPQASRPSQFNPNSGDTGTLFLRKQASMLLGQKQEAEYQGFRAAVNGLKDLTDTSIISIATAYPAKDALYYSVHIPLSALKEPLDPARPFSIGIIIKAAPMGDGGPGGGGGTPGGAPGGGPPDGGGGAPGGGGPPDGAGPGGGGPPSGNFDPDDFRKMFGEDAVWQQVKLDP